MSHDKTMQPKSGKFDLGAIGRRDMLGLGLGFGLTTMAASTFGFPAWAQTDAAATPPSKPTGVVVVGLSQEPVSFHPLMPGVEVDEIIWTNIFSSLWVAQPDGSLKPDLAIEVPSVENGGIAEGGLLWTVRLRDDVTWHDGKPFTAEDVKYSLELINQEGFRSRTRVGHSLLGEITVVGPHEISWRMTEAFSPYLALLANTHMVPRHLLEGEADQNSTAFGGQPVGTGPFKWDTRTPGDNITLAANETYHGDGPYLDQAVLKYVPDMTSLYAQFQTGQVDMVIISGIPQNFYAEAKNLPDREVFIAPSGNIELVMPNLDHPALREKPVRQALYYAMNKQVIIDAIYYGVPTVTESFSPRESWAYNPNLPAHVYDPEKANALLDEAGWVRGDGGMRSKDGVPLAFQISTTTGNQLREQVQQFLMQDWAAIGVALSINNMPAAVIWGDFYVRSQFESLLVGTSFRTGVDPDPAARFASTAIPLKGGSGGNYMQWQNAEADALMKEGQASFDQERRREIYHRLQEIVREELPILPIWQYAPVEGYKKGLVGFAPNINQRQNAWNMGSWFWGS
ncbi:peptide/nickel transport system substrate-binding protein [Hoeflea marina]|uniref:Peptide/nickel transport system substrate-binding protein n=1 Tax=Hoeflea marina TaxID=274592 RepID=A0A317PID8_9HYPH|nr:peptide ABC transporter substrate-binding protein [Hoeflea marina]PWV97803.1 peptide/nickel transport system substrate-binding protein [Hoeflea marina]